jgi:hypothetical protein
MAAPLLGFVLLQVLCASDGAADFPPPTAHDVLAVRPSLARSPLDQRLQRFTSEELSATVTGDTDLPESSCLTFHP